MTSIATVLGVVFEDLLFGIGLGIAIAIFFILMFLIPLKRAHGQIVLVYFILYSIMRSVAETFRGDSARGFVIENIVSTSQFISLLMSTIALIMIIFLSKKTKINHSQVN